MIRKYIAAAIIIAALGAGAYFLLNFIHGKGAAVPDDDQPVPSIVTVQTAQIRRMTLHGYAEGFGLVSPAPAEKGKPAAATDVASPVAGVLTEVKAWEGEPVRRGDLLFQLDSRVADVAVKYSEMALARQRALLQNSNTSEKAVEDAEQQAAQARAQRDLLQIRAPLSGTIAKVNVRPGEAVDLTTVLARIVDFKRLAINADLPGFEAGAVKVGDAAELETDPPQSCKVVFVSPAIQASNGTVSVRLSMPAASGLRPGQYVKARIVTATDTNCLAVPTVSVVKNDDGKEVIALVTGGAAAQTPVETGMRENGWVEIKGEGIREGGAVVTTGAYGLPDKTKIKAANP